MTAFITLVEREIKRFLKVIVQTVVTPAVSSFLYLLIFGVSLGDSVQMPGGGSYLAFLIPGLMMMGLINNSFQNSASSIVTSKFSGDIEDLRVVPITENAIIWAYGVGGLIRGAVVAIVTYFVGEAFFYVQKGSFLGIAHMDILLYFVVAGGLIFGLLGISIAFWSVTFEQMSAFSSFILLPLTYLGGVFISIEHLPPFWRIASECNPLLYLINGLRYGMIGKSDVEVGTSMIISLVGIVVFYALARMSLSAAVSKGGSVFEALSDKILGSVKKLRGQNKISEENVNEAVKEIRLSLLEADVNFKVVKSFVDRVKVKAVGAEVLAHVNPGQMFVKIVHDELVQTLGGGAVDIDVREKPSVLFMVGLQGAGKTTSSAKLALYIRQKLGKKPGLVPADIYRPAAIEQLQTLGKQIDVPVFPTTAEMKPEEILEKAKAWARDNMVDAVIVDTAGRLQVDDALMTELQNLKQIWTPQEVLLVADAMLGQQSVAVAEGFNGRLGLTGLILTKVDGDARGGAALSIREVTGVPIKFLGVGEKIAALEIFHPDRLAGRILGMGDVLSLVEKAQGVIDEKSAREQTRKMMKNEFTLEDFLDQMQSLKKMGGLEGIMKFLPGMGEISKQMKNMTPPDQEMKKLEAIMRSMTAKERKNHKILNASRRVRIATGSGTQVQDVNKLVRQFEDAQKMMSGIMKMGMGRGGSKLPFKP